MTTEELSRELVEIENALARLRAYRGEEFTDRTDGLWLNRRRSYVAALATIRRAQRGKKVVSLAVWRQGDLRSLVALADDLPVARAGDGD